jgi:hypothetical protein
MRLSRLLISVVAVAMGSCCVAGTAAAGVSGPCSATFAGVNVAKLGAGATSKPIQVKHDAVVPIKLQAPRRLTRVKIVLSFVGFSWTVKDKPATTPLYQDSLSVKAYAKYGVGLYKVTGQGNGAGFACSGSALVRVAGSPIGSIAGIAALVAAILGGGGLAAGVLAGRGGVGPFKSVGALLAGLLGAVGGLILLQQAAVLYPTRTVAIIGLAGGAGLGVLAPWLGKLLGSGTNQAR